MEESTFRVSLSWTPPVDVLGAPLPNVTGYRVYRTAVVNGGSGNEVLLATTASATFLDDGTATPGTAIPLPLGSTGQWAVLANMGAARKGLAMTYGFERLR